MFAFGKQKLEFVADKNMYVSWSLFFTKYW